MGAVLLAVPEGDDEASRVQECIRRSLRHERGVLWLGIRRDNTKIRAEIRDITSREIDWRVELSISAGTSDAEVDARVRQALALRVWDTAPPVTWQRSTSESKQ